MKIVIKLAMKITITITILTIMNLLNVIHYVKKLKINYNLSNLWVRNSLKSLLVKINDYILDMEFNIFI